MTRRFATPFMSPRPAGASEVRLLYENCGHASGGADLAQSGGVRAARLTGVTLAAAKPIDGWRMRLVNSTTNRPEVEPGFNDADWAAVAVNSENASQLTPDQKAVFRAGLNLTAADITGVKMILTFGRIDDFGWVYVNGQPAGQTTDWSHPYSFDVTRPGVWVPWHVRLNACGNGFIHLNGHAIGRYWEAGPQHDFFLPECWLNFGGHNNLTLSLRPLDHGAAIQSAVVEPYAESAEKK